MFIKLTHTANVHVTFLSQSWGRGIVVMQKVEGGSKFDLFTGTKKLMSRPCEHTKKIHNTKYNFSFYTRLNINSSI